MSGGNCSRAFAKLLFIIQNRWIVFLYWDDLPGVWLGSGSTVLHSSISSLKSSSVCQISASQFAISCLIELELLAWCAWVASSIIREVGLRLRPSPAAPPEELGWLFSDKEAFLCFARPRPPQPLFHVPDARAMLFLLHDKGFSTSKFGYSPE